jgi:hypothetical protein
VGSWPVSGSELFLDSPTSTTGYEPFPYSLLKSDKRSELSDRSFVQVIIVKDGYILPKPPLTGKQLENLSATVEILAPQFLERILYRITSFARKPPYLKGAFVPEILRMNGRQDFTVLFESLAVNIRD